VLDISKKSTSKFEFHFFERIETEKFGKGTVIGVGKSYLWVHLDKDDGVSYWDNGIDYRHLVEVVGWKLITPRDNAPSICTDILIEKLSNKLNFINEEFELVTKDVLSEEDIKNRNEFIFSNFKCNNCGAHKRNHVRCQDYSERLDIETEKLKTKIQLEGKQNICDLCNKNFTKEEFLTHRKNFAGCTIDLIIPENQFIPDGINLETLQLYENPNNGSICLSLKRLCLDALLGKIPFLSNEDICEIFRFSCEVNLHKLQRASLEQLTFRFLFIKEQPYFKILSSKYREIAYLSYVSKNRLIEFCEALKILEYSFRNDMEILLKFVKPIINERTFIPAYKISKNLKLFDVNYYCIEFASKIHLEKMYNLNSFQELPSELQQTLINEANQIVINDKSPEIEDDFFSMNYDYSDVEVSDQEIEYADEDEDV